MSYMKYYATVYNFCFYLFIQCVSFDDFCWSKSPHAENRCMDLGEVHRVSPVLFIKLVCYTVTYLSLQQILLQVIERLWRRK